MNRKRLQDCHVLVTPTSYGRDDEELKRVLEAQVGKVTYNTTGRPLTDLELIELIEDVDGYIAGLDVISREVLQAAKNLQVVARYGVGVDNVDLEAAQECGIIVTNTPGANAASVAELTVGLLLSMTRNLVPAVLSTRAGQWPRLRGQTLAGSTVGLIGFGNIGKQVARKLAGFDCKVLVYDTHPDAEFARECGIKLTSFDDVISNADFLSLHCSLVPDTHHLIDATCIAKMRDGVSLVNTARGELIDEAALLEALNSGKIRGAALDVFSQQPPDPSHALLQHPSVLVTPHMGSHTNGATNNMGWGALNNCLAVLGAEKPINPVT